MPWRAACEEWPAGLETRGKDGVGRHWRHDRRKTLSDSRLDYWSRDTPSTIFDTNDCSSCNRNTETASVSSRMLALKR